MSARVFLDTNIFVYSLDRAAPRKQEQATALVRETIAAGTAVISYQVVQEFLNVATMKFRTKISSKDSYAYLEGLLWPLCEIHPTPELYGRGLAIRVKTGWSFYDSLIVSAALVAECNVLYSEDLQSGRFFEGLEIRNPFK